MGNHEAFKPAPLNYYYITVVVIIIFLYYFCYHLIIGLMSISQNILESSFSYGTGYLQVCGMQQVFCFACETNLLQYFLLASLNSLQFFSVLQKLCYTSSHMQFLTVSFFKNRVWAGGGGEEGDKGNRFFLFFCFVTILLLKVPKGFLKKWAWTMKCLYA